jgi:hypothetical protein
MKRIDSILAAIAREHLNIPTLEIRRSDSLDFHMVAVWNVKTALKAAYNAGRRSAGTQPAPTRKPIKKLVSGQSQPGLVVPKETALIPDQMYLRLYHGRTDPNQKMPDWGFDGPTFGPLSCYVQTYSRTLRIHGYSDDDEVWLKMFDDMIQWEGSFYGDMEIFVARDNDRA